MTSFRRIIMIWLAAWMLAIPLVHVHPEADHQHGRASHFHGGITHSVFSADLPCEYRTHSSGNPLHITSQAAHEFDHPEIAFSLLISSPDRSGKPALSVAFCEETALVPPGWTFIVPAPVNSAIAVVLPIRLSPRAPPVPA
jgi:hypothetical protein